MEVQPYDIEYFGFSDGSCPVKTWITNLRDRQAKAEVVIRLQRLSEGNLGDYKSLEGGLYELRIFTGPGYRVYFALIKGRMVVLLAGGDKSTQSVDIRKAREYLALYTQQETAP